MELYREIAPLRFLCIPLSRCTATGSAAARCWAMGSIVSVAGQPLNFLMASIDRGEEVHETAVGIAEQDGAVAPWHRGGLLHPVADQRLKTLILAVDVVNLEFEWWFSGRAARSAVSPATASWRWSVCQLRWRITLSAPVRRCLGFRRRRSSASACRSGMLGRPRNGGQRGPGRGADRPHFAFTHEIG